MGEAKRREATMTEREKGLRDLSRKLANDGRLIETGWIGLQLAWLHPDTPPESVKMMRWAFMAGAQHLFSSIMTIMDPGSEPTADDLRKMDLIAAEMKAFYAEVVAAAPTEGRA